MSGLTIGKVAKSVGIGIETVRFYERKGLIQPPIRTEANYRLYTDDGIARLRFIKQAKSLGFTLREIKELLLLRVRPDATKADIKKQIHDKINDVEMKINDLKAIKKSLKSLDSCCDGHGSAFDCPILMALDGCDNVTADNCKTCEVH